METPETKPQAEAKHAPIKKQRKFFHLGRLFVIERKTDVLAFTAFVISLFGLFCQFTDFLRGPKMELIPPTAITLGCVPDQVATSQTNALTFTTNAASLHIFSDMAYINDGAAQYGDAVISEWMTAACGTNTCRMLAHRYVDVTRQETFRNDLVVIFRSSAVPVGVQGGATVTHTSQFAPDGPHTLTIESFVRYVQTCINRTNPIIFSVTMECKLHSEKTIIKKYNAEISAAHWKNFITHGWVNAELTEAP